MSTRRLRLDKGVDFVKQTEIQETLQIIATNTANTTLTAEIVNLNTDGLESLQTTANATLASILVDTDAADSSLNTIEAQSVLTASRLNNIQNKISANVDGTGSTLGQIANSILAKNTEIETSADALIAANHTDLVALEASLTSMEGKIDTLDTVLDNCLVKHTNNETLLTAGNVDHAANEVLLTAIAADGDAIQTKLDTLETSANAIQSAVEGAIPTGTNRIGRIGITANESHNGSGTERHLVCDENGRLQVDVRDAEGSLTVSGTVTANLSTTDNDVLDAILAKNTEIETSADALIAANHTDLVALEASLTSMEGKIDTLDTVLDNCLVKHTNNETLLTAANVDHAANEVLLTNCDGHLGNIETSVQALDDIVLAEDAVHSSGQKGVMFLGVRQSSQADFAADGDYTPLSIDDDGKLRVTSSAASGGSTEAKQDTLIGHVDNVEGKLDTLETTLTAIETDQAAIEVLLTAANVDHAANEVLLTNAEAHLGNIDTGVDVLEACVGSNKVNVNISSGNITGFATQTTLAAAETHLGNIDTGVDVLEACVGSNKVNVNISSGNITGFATQTTLADAETHLGNIDSDTDAIKTSAAALVTDLAAIEVLLTAANVDHAANEVLLTAALSKGEAMETDTIMSGVSINSGANANSDTYTKPRGIKDFAIAIVAATSGAYNAFLEYSVDDSTYFRGSNLNMSTTATNTVAVGGATVSSGYRYYRVNIVNNHGGAQNFTIKISY